MQIAITIKNTGSTKHVLDAEPLDEWKCNAEDIEGSPETISSRNVLIEQLWIPIRL